MAVEITMIRAARRIATALAQYASDHGLGRNDYEIYFWFNVDWDRINVIFVAKDFPGTSYYDKWLAVDEHLGRALHDDPSLVRAITMSIRTIDEVNQGGLYAISRDFIESRELFDGGVAAMI